MAPGERVGSHAQPKKPFAVNFIIPCPERYVMDRDLMPRKEEFQAFGGRSIFTDLGSWAFI